ncbi:hypothetical protein ES703_121150 [subsurface metagenome]
MNRTPEAETRAARDALGFLATGGASWGPRHGRHSPQTPASTLTGPADSPIGALRDDFRREKGNEDQIPDITGERATEPSRPLPLSTVLVRHLPQNRTKAISL